MNTILEIEIKSKAEGLEKAKKILDLDEDKIEYEIDKGFWGGIFSKKPSILKVKNKENIPDLSKIRGTLYTLFDKLGIGIEIESVKETSENYIISIKSKYKSFIIGKKGKNIDSFQFLLNLLLSNTLKKDKRVLIDIDGYREKRKTILQKIARNLANKVAISGKSLLMEPLNPYERRIVHLELEKDKRVTTESEGNGLYKRIRIIKITSEKEKKTFEDNFEEGDIEEV
ncbi:MAG: protein jag [Leptonema sp. (in: bacteria)]